MVCGVTKACNSVIFLVKMAKLKAFQTPLTINLDTATHRRRPEFSNIIQFIKLRNSFAICQEILSIRMRPIELQWMGKVHSNLLSKAVTSWCPDCSRTRHHIFHRTIINHLHFMVFPYVIDNFNS